MIPTLDSELVMMDVRQ